MQEICLPIADSDRLSVRLERPVNVEATACLLYAHGFASRQDGDKANHFRRHAVAAGLAFCSFDFRAHGDSSGDMFELTLSRNLEDLACVESFLRDQGLGRIALMGSSMGGGTVLWRAARQPRLPRASSYAAVVCIAPSIELEQGLLRLAGDEAARRWQAEGRWFFQQELGGYDLSWRLIEDLRTYRLSDLADGLRTPTLIFQGQQDATVDWRAVSGLAASCVHGAVETRLFSDGDHRLIDRLDAMWSATADFLARQGILDV